MPLVFVHGVNVRRGNSSQEQATFDEQVATRDELFHSIALAGILASPASAHITNPYWGDHGARFRYDLVSVPSSDNEAFGPEDEPMAAVVFATIPFDVAMNVQSSTQVESNLLVTLARQHSLAHAVDAMVSAAAVQTTQEATGELASGAELANFAATALRYAATNPSPTWLTTPVISTGRPIQTDDQFVDRLLDELARLNVAGGSNETFGGLGLGERLKSAGRALGGAAKRAAGAIVKVVKGTAGAAVGAVVGAVAGAAAGGTPGSVVKAFRPLATRRAGQFLGDVFVYLAHRDPIQAIVGEALIHGHAARTEQDSKLIVVAHSMGGNIVYDLLTSSLAGRVEVDAFITVGSQVGLFKELALYTEDQGKERLASPPRISKPSAVATWINVFDPLDVLGFAAGGVFKDVSDFAFSNDASVLETHSTYFFRPAFHQRLRERLAGAGLGTPA